MSRVRTEYWLVTNSNILFTHTVHTCIWSLSRVLAVTVCSESPDLKNVSILTSQLSRLTQSQNNFHFEPISQKALVWRPATYGMNQVRTRDVQRLCGRAGATGRVTFLWVRAARLGFCGCGWKWPAHPLNISSKDEISRTWSLSRVILVLKPKSGMQNKNSLRKFW